MSNRAYNSFLLQGNFGIEFYVQTGLAANYAIVYPNAAPTNGQSLRWNTSNGCFEWFTPSAGNAGTVTSVALALPTNEFDVTGTPVSSSGTLTGSWKSQPQNRVLASPVSGAGNPVFRALQNADIPSGIDAAKISGVFARANIPNGTQATSFQLGSGVTLVDDSGSLKICAADGTTITDLTVRNLNVTGNIDTVSSTNTLIGDSQITLLGNYTGSTPSTNASYSVERGTLTNASLRWNETTDRWEAGFDDNLLDIAREASTTFTNANISSNSFVFTHNLRASGKDPSIIVKNNNNVQVLLGVTFTSSDSVTLDFSRVGTLTGTWQVTAIA